VRSYLVFKAMFFGGVYDTWAPGGGDVRVITNPTLNPAVIFGYLAESTLWRRRLDHQCGQHGRYHWWPHLGRLNLYLRWYLAHLNQAFRLGASRLSSGLVKLTLSYSLGALSLMGFIAAVMVWYNNTAYPSEFYGPTGMEASQVTSIHLLGA
jgi:photosystem II CP43 chlorophyll apoprotein